MNGNDAAYPTYLPGIPGIVAPVEEMGLTKRELFAAMAMQGLLAHSGHYMGIEGRAVNATDRLLSELSKPTEVPNV